MADIYSIMQMLDWKQSADVQNEGLRLAKEVESIQAFLQPCNRNFNKNVWDNCAKALSERSDEELLSYLVPLMEWMQDMNWPGADRILDRLRHFSDRTSLMHAYQHCLTCARAQKNAAWEANLQMLLKSS